MKPVEKVEIAVEELNTLNTLILQLVDIAEFTKKVETRVEEVINNNPLDYADEDGDVAIDKETVIDQAVEMEFEAEYGTVTPTIIYEAVHEKFDDGIWDGLEETITEVSKETKEYNRDPLGYHGMSQKDFL